MSPYLTIPTVIKFLKDNKWNEIREKCREINYWARNEINDLLNKEPLCSEKFLGQMSSIYIDCDDSIAFQIKLYKQYKIQIPITECNNNKFLRISIQAYNSKEDVFKLLRALKKEFP